MRVLLLVLAVGYPLALLTAVLTMRGIGERWWVTTVALYLPRIGFALPLPFLTLALAFIRPRRWLITQALAVLLLLFPLMGLTPFGSRAPTTGAIRLRVLSCNIDLGSQSIDDLAAMLRSADADIVCLQEARGDEVEALKSRLSGYAFRADDQFIVASRYAIAEVFTPPRIPHNGETHAPNFVRYRLAAPGGMVDIYNVHPVSPHSAFDKLRGPGLVRELTSGRILVNREGLSKVSSNAALRSLQVRAIAEDAARSPYPVLIVGDTNLPSLSWALSRWLGGYQDGFAEVGWGWGYTFPAKKRPPWLRIDRVLADAHFRFLRFTRLDDRISSHFAVVADLERVPERVLNAR